MKAKPNFLGVGSCCCLGRAEQRFFGAAGADMLRSARSCIPAWSGPECVRRRTNASIHYFRSCVSLDLQLSVNLFFLSGAKFQESPKWLALELKHLAWMLFLQCLLSTDTSGIKRQKSEQIRNSWPICAVRLGCCVCMRWRWGEFRGRPQSNACCVRVLDLGRTCLAFSDRGPSIIRLFRTPVLAGQLAHLEGPNYKMPLLRPSAMNTLSEKRLLLVLPRDIAWSELCLCRTSDWLDRWLMYAIDKLNGKKHFANHTQMSNAQNAGWIDLLRKLKSRCGSDALKFVQRLYY
jgi:hypothetical protein